MVPAEGAIMKKQTKRKTRKPTTAERRATVASASSRPELALLLRGIRLSRGLSVRDIARAAQTTVGRVSLIERGGDVFVSEVQRYVAALGCELRLECTSKDP